MAYRRNPGILGWTLMALPVAAVGGGVWYMARGRKKGVFAAIQKAIAGKPGAEEITYSDVQGRIPPPVLGPVASDMEQLDGVYVVEGWTVSDRLWALLGISSLEESFISLSTGRVATLEAPATQQELAGSWAMLGRKQDIQHLKMLLKKRQEAPVHMPPVDAGPALDGLRGIAYRSSIDSPQWTSF
jgi:hypothetical protein